MKTVFLKEELENKISDYIKKDNVNRCEIEFIYDHAETNLVELLVITHNPVHRSSFLFSKSYGVTEESALKNLILSLEKPPIKEEFTFTVTWEKIGESTQNSYFVGNNIYEVLDKFYHGKNPKEYIIFNIKLNPIS